MAPVTNAPMQDVDIDIPDADMYEEKFRENERKKLVHVLKFEAYDASLLHITVCGLFMSHNARAERPGDTRCPECVDWMTRRYGPEPTK